MRLIGLVALFLFSPFLAFAQTQVRAPGKAYVNVSTQFQSSDRSFNQEGESRQGATLEQLVVSAYGEVGLIDRWLMLSVNAELLRRSVLPDQGATTGLGDLRLGAWTEWLTAGRFRLLSGLQLGLPTGDDQPSSGGDEQSEFVARSLPTGDGEVDVELSALLSVDLSFDAYPLRHYLIAQAGYWLRTSGFSDAFSYRGELGTQIKDVDFIWLIGRIRGVEAFEQPEAGGSVSGVGIGNGISYTVLGPELHLRLPLKFSMGFGLDVPLQGRGVLDALAYKGFLAYEI